MSEDFNFSGLPYEQSRPNMAGRMLLKYITDPIILAIDSTAVLTAITNRVEVSLKAFIANHNGYSARWVNLSSKCYWLKHWHKNDWP